MRLNPGQLAAALQRDLQPLYLIAGEEPLLMQEALDAIRSAARSKGYSEREVLDAEKGFDWQTLRDACNAMSLFASLRIVELRLSGAPDAAGASMLTELAKSPPRDVLLLVQAGKVEWRSRNGGWFAALEAAGAALYFEPMKRAELPAWIAGRLRIAGLDAEPDAVQLMAERTEGNLLAAQQDVHKLALLHGSSATQRNVLDAQMIADAVANSAHIEVFGWLNTVMAGESRAAVRGLAVLRGEGVDLVPLLAAFVSGLRQLATAAAAFARSGNAAAAVEAARVFKPNQAAYQRAVERTTVNQVLGWLRKTAQIDHLSKSTGGQSQAWEELLTLVLAASGAARPRGMTIRR